MPYEKARQQRTLYGHPQAWAVYNRLAPVLLILCCLAVMACSVGVFVESRTNRAQDQQRLSDQAAAQRCFDRFASTLAGGLPPVRKASQARDAALGTAMEELRQSLSRLIRDEISNRDVVELVEALNKYRHAEHHLNKVRARNPYPDAPRDACDLTGGTS